MKRSLVKIPSSSWDQEVSSNWCWTKNSHTPIDAARAVIGRWIRRNGPKPTSRIIAATRIAMTTFVPIVLNHGIQPLRIIPIGRVASR